MVNNKHFKLQKKSLATQLAELLEKSIEEGKWKKGEKIPSESELSEIYGVSRNTLREAIHYLVVTGLLDVRPGDGTYVKNVTAFDATMHKRLQEEEVSNIIDARLVIEPAVCAMAAERRTDSEMKILEEKHQKLIKSYEESSPEYIQIDTDLHMCIADMCHNLLMKDLYRNVINYYPVFVKDSFLSFIQSENLDLYLHKELVECIKNKDSEGAKKITEYMIKKEASDLNIDFSK